MEVAWEKGWRGSHLVRPVVVLRVILENLLALGVLEVAHQRVRSELFPPFLVVDEPAFVRPLVAWALSLSPGVQKTPVSEGGGGGGGKEHVHLLGSLDVELPRPQKA